MLTALRSRLALALSAAGLVACAVVESVDGARYRVGSAGFRSYVEQVFRDQNETADALAFALEDLDPAQADAAAALDGAETSILAACRELNRLAVSRRDGVKMGARDSLAAARTAPDCERASRAARRVLDDLD